MCCFNENNFGTAIVMYVCPKFFLILLAEKNSQCDWLYFQFCSPAVSSGKFGSPIVIDESECVKAASNQKDYKR